MVVASGGDYLELRTSHHMTITVIVSLNPNKGIHFLFSLKLNLIIGEKNKKRFVVSKRLLWIDETLSLNFLLELSGGKCVRKPWRYYSF